MTARGWREQTAGAEGMEQLLTNFGKRIDHQETRPSVQKASDILGPGISPYANRLLDWNSPEAQFNGFWYSIPGDLNTPDEDVHWIGETIGTGDFFGLQKAWAHRSDEWPAQAMVRKFFDPGTSSASFSEWVSQTNLEPILLNMTSDVLYPGAMPILPGLSQDIEVRSFSDRFMVGVSALINCRWPGQIGTVGLLVRCTLDGAPQAGSIYAGVNYRDYAVTVTGSDSDSDSDTAPVTGSGAVPQGSVTVDIDIDITISDTFRNESHFDITNTNSRQWLLGPMVPGTHTVEIEAQTLNTDGDFQVLAAGTQMTIMKVA